MSKFQLSGVQRDTVNALAIHQDTDGLVDFIQTLVDEQLAQGAPPDVPPAPSKVEQAILDLVKAKIVGNARAESEFVSNLAEYALRVRGQMLRPSLLLACSLLGGARKQLLSNASAIQ